MYATCQRVDVSTPPTAGSVTVFTPPFTGRVLAVYYLRPTQSPFGVNADFIVTSETTNELIWQTTDAATSRTCRPRVKVHSPNGAQYEGYDYIVLAEDRLKIVVTQAGAGRTGVFHFVIG